jgi:hypothetical protein
VAMDFFGTEMIIDKNTKYICKDEEFNKEWNANIYIQAWISALKSVYGTKDGDEMEPRHDG